jgi:hypothetical protein
VATLGAGELWRGDALALHSDLLDGCKALKGEVLEVSFDSEVVMARYNVGWQSKFGHLSLG